MKRVLRMLRHVTVDVVEGLDECFLHPFHRVPWLGGVLLYQVCYRIARWSWWNEFARHIPADEEGADDE